MSAKTKIKYLIGVDEAGRGPLAGPVAVGAILVRADRLARVRRRLSGAKDCKQLSERQREAWLGRIKAAQRAGDLDFAVSFTAAKVIDRRGIVPAIRLAVYRTLKRLELNPAECRVLLDGSLRAPRHFIDQQTIIRGDESEQLIALASITAKVRRDRYMLRQAKRYPGYGFEAHKGYGSAAHCLALRRIGPCPIHRQTFIKNLVA